MISYFVLLFYANSQPGQPGCFYYVQKLFLHPILESSDLLNVISKIIQIKIWTKISTFETRLFGFEMWLEQHTTN